MNCTLDKTSLPRTDWQTRLQNGNKTNNILMSKGIFCIVFKIFCLSSFGGFSQQIWLICNFIHSFVANHVIILSKISIDSPRIYFNPAPIHTSKGCSITLRDECSASCELWNSTSHLPSNLNSTIVIALLILFSCEWYWCDAKCLSPLWCVLIGQCWM